MTGKIILHRPDKNGKYTLVELIGEGHYAIYQEPIFGHEPNDRLVFLTKEDLLVILAEKEIEQPKEVS